MPLTREKKESIVADLSSLLEQSKMTVVATYKGTAVKDMQALRAQAKENGTTVKVIKNRLVVQALKQLENLKDIDATKLEGMLVYAFNQNDEIAPAQNLATFAKNNSTLSFVGAITPEGKWLTAEEVTSLASLPSKPILIASVVALLGSPIRSVVSSLSSQLPNILSSLQNN
jgi:large subunit ribosomal protein L10